MTARAGSPAAGEDGAFYIVADDLTGALDTAGGLASMEHPFDIPLRDGHADGPRVAIDTDSRDAAQDDAGRRAARAIGAFKPRPGAVFFKKIDSVLRGHPIAEAAAAFRAGGFDRALVAPAFPDLGRVTRDGRQFIVTREGARAVGPELVEAFRSQGLDAIRLGDADRGADVVVADAEDNAALLRAVAEMKALGGRTLYVGSAGLAQAFRTGAPAPIAVPCPDLTICGTAHPATLAQVERLRGSAIPIETMDGAPGRGAGFPMVFVAPAGVVSESAARPAITRSIAALIGDHPPPRCAVVTGGWTLRTVLEHTRAERLLCIGLHLPGVPVSLVVGGSWHGTMIVSKSGGFGGADFLLELFSSAG